MVKEPRAGRVKTRLGRDIGMTEAAWWFRHQSRSLLRRLEDPRWRIYLAVTPDIEGMSSRVWPSQFRRIPQGQGDLGRRMSRALARTVGPSLLIGADIPGVSKAHILRGFRSLGSAPSVVGPTPDGGFWLIGLRYPTRRYPQLFQNVRWSHPKTLDDALPTLPAPVGIIDTLRDVDDAEDLRALEEGVDASKPRDLPLRA